MVNINCRLWIPDLGKHAWRTLQFKADTDVVMLNALIHTVINEGLVAHAPPLHGSLPPEGASPALGRPGGVRAGCDWNYQGEHNGVAAVYEEMRQAMHASISGTTWERLEHESSVTSPCLSVEDPGSATVFIDKFLTADGRVRLVPADIIPANERPGVAFPFVLISGRQLEHWHTGSMTRRTAVLDAIEPIATASMCGADLLKLGLAAGDYEAAANLLTNAKLDPFGKISEFKYCAVAVRAGEEPAQSVGYGLALEAVCSTV